MSTSGVVIGKFMPLHTGHIFLIEFAKNFVDDLTVLVDNLPDHIETMTLEDRVSIVKQTFPDLNVKGIDVVTYQEPEDAPDFWECWRDYIIRNVGKKPDYIIGSMDYIKKLADVIGCEYIMIDKERTHIPISATIIRNAIKSYLHGDISSYNKIKQFIPLATKQYLIKDVYIVGGESTGKTTLSSNLAESLSTTLVKEYAINYIKEVGRDLNERDLLNIARGQLALQNTMRDTSNIFCIHDTDIITTKIWYKKFFGTTPSLFDELIKKQKNGFYILMKPSINWINEDYRYFEDQKDREWFHEEFKKELTNYNKQFIEIDPTHYSIDGIKVKLLEIYDLI